MRQNVLRCVGVKLGATFGFGWLPWDLCTGKIAWTNSSREKMLGLSPDVRPGAGAMSDVRLLAPPKPHFLP